MDGFESSNMNAKDAAKFGLKDGVHGLTPNLRSIISGEETIAYLTAYSIGQAQRIHIAQMTPNDNEKAMKALKLVAAMIKWDPYA